MKDKERIKYLEQMIKAQTGLAEAQQQLIDSMQRHINVLITINELRSSHDRSHNTGE